MAGGCWLGSPQTNSAESPQLRPTGLRCEYRQNPLGMDVVQPRLSWTLEASPTARGAAQSAFHLLVASTPEKLADDQGDLWDTGKVLSDQTIQIAYAGAPLPSRSRAYWKVRVWDQEGRPSAWSEPARWTMGLLATPDWPGRWIADPGSVTNVAARGPHNGYHSALAESADKLKWVAIDLGEPRSFDGVRLFPARPYDWQPDTPGFLFPVRFRIEAATLADFSDTRLLLDRTAVDEPNPETSAPLHRFASATARFVRLTATKLGRRDTDNYAFALAEMQILNGDTNLARNAKVLALDSIETGAWSAANLTDGVTVTVRPDDAGALPATMVRKSFLLDRPIKRATAYATALGLYELRLNGRRVGDQLLAPEWTSYRKRVAYQTFEVTEFLRPGENAVAALLGEGWYAGRLMVVGRYPYGTHPRFLLQLEIELADGSKQVVSTDDSWRTTTDGPIRAAGIYDGETYDARHEQPGWDQPGFDDTTWARAQAFDLDARALVWLRNEPIRVVRELTPRQGTEPRPGVFVFDLGQNMVGWCRVQATGSAGQTITMRHAEMLNDDGTLYTANLRAAPQVNRYTPRADGPFVYEPHFTYQGFRYVELTGLAEPPTNTAVLGRVFHSTSPVVGQFECSDPSLNQLMQNIVWTQRANLLSSPNDCPQRDERFGWMGDIQAFAQTAIFNMDLAAFLTKFAQDLRDDQADDGRFPDFAPHPGDPNKSFSGAPAWADAGTIVPWRAYQNYADTRLLADHFEAARRWVDYVHQRNPDLTWSTNRHNDYNDWLNGDWIKQEGWPSRGGSVSNVVFATAFFAHSTELVAKMARVLGRSDDARRYGELFDRIKGVFNQRFVQPDGRIESDTQGAYALALNFDLLPDDLRPQAAIHLVENVRRYQNHLATGIQTTHRAMLELTRQGYPDLSWQLLTNRTFPSWLYMIDNGATTIWERWDGYVKGRGFQDAGMNSFNHWAFGAVGEWMWRHIAGLHPDEAQPGWKHFVVAPKPGGGVTWARGEYDSIRGRIGCDWRIEGAKLTLRVTVPPNTSATVQVPTAQPSAVTESGKPAAEAGGVVFRRAERDAAVYEVSSGTYRFEAPFDRPDSPRTSAATPPAAHRLLTAAGLPAEGELTPFLGEPRFELQPVFAEDRFPTVVVATDGTVLAFWNGVRVRRSEDGGQTWGPEMLVGDGFMGGGVTVDESTGHILAFVEAGHPPAALSLYRSTDHGRSWQAQDTVIHPDRKGHAPSMHMNEHGITLRHGKHRGRLLRPSRVYAGGNDRSRWPEHYTNAIYSDDGGRTWNSSDLFPANGTGEAALAELADGRIYYNSRRHWAPEGENARRRWTAWSEDGGQTWQGLALCEVLPDGDQDRDYGLMGGLARLPVRDRDILLFSNIESPSGRHHGHVWASFDGGKTWPVKRLVFAGPFAYSSLDAGRPGTPSEGWIYLLFEGGPQGSGTVARFNLAWLLGGEKTGDGAVPPL
jgi:alpha-L-rhamnosidase